MIENTSGEKRAVQNSTEGKPIVAASALLGVNLGVFGDAVTKTCTHPKRSALLFPSIRPAIRSARCSVHRLPRWSVPFFSTHASRAKVNSASKREESTATCLFFDSYFLSIDFAADGRANTIMIFNASVPLSALCQAFFLILCKVKYCEQNTTEQTVPTATRGEGERRCVQGNTLDYP